MGAISGFVSLLRLVGEDESYCTPGTSQLLRAWPAGCRCGRPHRVRLDGLAIPGIWWAPMSESTLGRGHPTTAVLVRRLARGGRDRGRLPTGRACHAPRAPAADHGAVEQPARELHLRARYARAARGR